MLAYVDAGVVEYHPSCRDVPLELLFELAVVGEEVSCQRLGLGVDHCKALTDLVNLPTATECGSRSSRVVRKEIDV